MDSDTVHLHMEKCFCSVFAFLISKEKSNLKHIFSFVYGGYVSQMLTDIMSLVSF